MKPAAAGRSGWGPTQCPPCSASAAPCCPADPQALSPPCRRQPGHCAQALSLDTLGALLTLCLAWNALSILPHLANTYRPSKPSLKAQSASLETPQEAHPRHLVAPSKLPEHCSSSDRTYNHTQAASCSRICLPPPTWATDGSAWRPQLPALQGGWQPEDAHWSAP